MTRRIHAMTARHLRCSRCGELGAPWVIDGWPTCIRCRLSMPEQPPSEARNGRTTDDWAAGAEFVGKVPRSRGRHLDIYRYDGKSATLQQWACAFCVTRQALWKARRRLAARRVNAAGAAA